MAKKRTLKATKAHFDVDASEVGEAETFTYAVKPELTAREKKAILEREVHCRKCASEGERVLAASVTDDGTPICRQHK